MSLISATTAAVENSPREIFNWYLFGCTWVWSFSGVAKGFDEGNIASLVTMAVLKKRFGIDNHVRVPGLACVKLTEKLGRKLTMQIFTIIYIAGILGQTFASGSMAGLYVSRIVSGIGIDATTVLPPVYISEIAPRPIHGLLTLQYTCCQQLGVVFGFFFKYGITKHFSGSHVQWQLPTALQIAPAIIWGLGTFFTPESARFLFSRGKSSEALKVLYDFRSLPADHPYVQDEFRAMEAQREHEMEIVSGATVWDLATETWTDMPNRRRFILMFLAHLFSQWSGANAITQYSPSIFGYLGIQGEEGRLLATGVYAILKFVSVLLLSVFVIDFIGRRRSLITGICLQITTLLFVGIYLKITNGHTPEEISSDPATRRASEASIAAIYLHAIAWSIGCFSIPHLVSAEVFPIRITSLCVSVLMAFHWEFYFGRSRAMPSLLAATDRYGAFIFFAAICSISLAYVYLAMPETSGRSLESMESLFSRPWYTVHKRIRRRRTLLLRPWRGTKELRTPNLP
ncbi:quinate permease [Colletotrichum sojae]|uniref:Quinate permease n=1 Tax=Colletotrichum sojae TaxID=2175907 RepID=A0A8H6JGA2_9PEZI|nr:quinate permease [Colletotrichum sojae]